MFNTNRSTLTAVVLALAVLVSAGAVGVMGAAPSVDTESSDTSQTSDLTNGGVQTYNTTTSSNLSWSADSDSSKVLVEQNGTTLYSATPSNYSYNSSTGTYYYNVSLADDGSDYTGLDVGADKNATLNVTFINNTSASSPNMTNISVTFDNADTEAFVRADTASTESDDGLLSSLSMFDSEEVGPAQSDKTTSIVNTTDKVTISATNANLSDSLGEATTDKSDSALLWTAHVKAGDSYVPVLYKSASDAPEWLDTSNESYAVVSSDGSTVTIHNAAELAADDGSATSLDVTVTGNEALGLTNARSLALDYGASQTTALTTAIDALDVNGEPEYVEE